MRLPSVLSSARLHFHVDIEQVHIHTRHLDILESLTVTGKERLNAIPHLSVRCACDLVHDQSHAHPRRSHNHLTPSLATIVLMESSCWVLAPSRGHGPLTFLVPARILFEGLG